MFGPSVDDILAHRHCAGVRSGHPNCLEAQVSRVKNEMIGKVPCPFRSCTETCGVFRFKGRTEGRARFAGKLYSACPVHGRYGADASPASQEYILENATIWGEGNKAPAAAVAAPGKNTSSAAPPKETPVVATPAPPVKVPAASPAPAPKTPAPKWWESWRPIIR